MRINIEKPTLYVLSAIAVVIPVADFFGVIDKVMWIQERKATYILLSLGVLMAFLVSHLGRREEEAKADKSELLAAITIDESLKTFRDALQSSWKAREADINRIFTEAEARGHTADSLEAYLRTVFWDLAAGRFFGSIVPLPWDFTLLAIDFDGNILFHPSLPRGLRIEVDSYLQRVLKERSGDLHWKNNLSSEQLSALFPNRPPTNLRFTKVYFRELSDARAIVVFESHINVVDRLPMIHKKLTGPTSRNEQA
jgi:hypothetical protein